MAKNNKKKTKETKTIIENKEEIIEKKEEAVGEKDVPADDKRRELIQNTIPNKAMNMFFSSWWAISAALALYLFFYAATVHEEARYAMLNQVYSIFDMNLLVFYTENAKLLFKFALMLVFILVPGLYICVLLLVIRNFYTVVIAVLYLISIVSAAFFLQKKIEIYMIVIALAISPIYIFLIMKVDQITTILKTLTGKTYEPKKPLKKSPTNNSESNILIKLLFKQMIIGIYGLLIFIMFYISVIVIFSAIAKDMGEDAAQIELNSRAYKSNTPINIKPKYFEIEIPTVSCKDLSCIKFGQQRIDSIE